MLETCIYKIINGFSNIDCNKLCGKYNECHGLITIKKNINGVRKINDR